MPGILQPLTLVHTEMSKESVVPATPVATEPMSTADAMKILQHTHCDGNWCVRQAAFIFLRSLLLKHWGTVLEIVLLCALGTMAFGMPCRVHGMLQNFCSRSVNHAGSFGGHSGHFRDYEPMPYNELTVCSSQEGATGHPNSV